MRLRPGGGYGGGYGGDEDLPGSYIEEYIIPSGFQVTWIEQGDMFELKVAGKSLYPENRQFEALAVRYYDTYYYGPWPSGETVVVGERITRIEITSDNTFGGGRSAART